MACATDFARGGRRVSCPQGLPALREHPAVAGALGFLPRPPVEPVQAELCPILLRDDEGMVLAGPQDLHVLAAGRAGVHGTSVRPPRPSGNGLGLLDLRGHQCGDLPAVVASSVVVEQNRPNVGVATVRQHLAHAHPGVMTFRGFDSNPPRRGMDRLVSMDLGQLDLGQLASMDLGVSIGR